MRAYKTVNDAYIEPISFTVPRRAEVFQSDIYPPATGMKPAMSAAEWLSGKDGIPSKIDLESVYEGNTPVEVASNYNTSVSAPAPTPAPGAAPPKTAPEPTPVSRAPPPTMSEQKGSIASLADKFQDNDLDEDDDDSSFEEISQPIQKSIPSGARSDTKHISSPTVPSTKTPLPKPVPIAASTSPTSRSVQLPIISPTPMSTSTVTTSSSTNVESSLEQIKSLLEAQTKTITAQSEKIGHLAQEVDTLKMRVGSGTTDQSERIRQLELELEAARS
jgi:coronin-1B/1C/6